MAKKKNIYDRDFTEEESEILKRVERYKVMNNVRFLSVLEIARITKEVLEERGNK